MVIIWGSGLYGKVDVVPGVGHVATNFGHLYYIPLIPTQSHFIISESSDGFQGVPISMSGKSILMAWFRTALIIASITMVVMTLLAFSDGKTTQGFINLGGLTGCLGLLIATYRSRMFCQASYDRAMSLAEQIGMNEVGMVLIEVQYGVLSEEEGQKRLKKLASAAATDE